MPSAIQVPMIDEPTKKSLLAIHVPNRGDSYFDCGIVKDIPLDLNNRFFREHNNKQKARTYLRSSVPAKDRQKISTESEIEFYCESLGLNKAVIFTRHHWEIRKHERGKWLTDDSELSKSLKKIEHDSEKEIKRAIINIRNALE